VTGISYGDGTDSDAVTVAYDSLGSELWVKRYNGPDNDVDQAWDIATDAAGHVFVTGISRSTATYNDYLTIAYASLGN